MYKCLGPSYHKNSNDFQSLLQFVLSANLASKHSIWKLILLELLPHIFVNYLWRNFIL